MSKGFFSRVALAGLLGLLGLYPGTAAALINVGALDTFSAADVEVAGDIAYVADASGLLVVDVSDPTNPVEIGRLDAAAVVTGVAVEGDLAYLTEGRYPTYDFDGLRVIDVSNPAAPVELGSLPTPSPALDVQVMGGLAYVTTAEAESGLRVIDVSDPFAPVEIGALRTPSAAMSVKLVGDLAYVADFLEGVRVVDVSDPTDPTEIGVYAIGGTRHVEVVGDLAYVASEGGLYVLDVSDPATPLEVGSSDPRLQATHVQVADDLAYVVAYYTGLHVIDVSDPSAPRQLGRLRTQGGPVDIQVVGELAYVADVQLTGWPPDAPPEGGLRIIDVSNPYTPAELLVSAGTQEYAQDVEIVGDLAYFVGRWEGVLVFDVSDPTSPVSLGAPYGPYHPSPPSYEPVWSEDIEIVGDLAYVAHPQAQVGDTWVGLEIIDLSDPTSPVSLGSAPWSAHDVEVAGDLAFTVGGGGLFIIDVSDATSPITLGRVSTPGPGRDVEVIGNLAYVADGDRGLQIVDISDLYAPVRLGSHETPDYTYDVEVVGDRVYMIDRSEGLRIIDVSDPTAPVEIGTSRPLRSGRDVEIVGDLAYVLGPGVHVFDVSDPTAPRELGIAGPCGRSDLEVVGTLVFRAQGTAGLCVSDFGPEYHTKVGIDIQPRSPVNRINLMRRGYVEVAILGSERFDVLDVDAATLAFGPAGAPPIDPATARVEDTDMDGFADLVLDFRTEEAGIAFGDTEACILGETWDAVPIGGCDAVEVLGPDFTPPGLFRHRLRVGGRAAAASLMAPETPRLKGPRAQVQ